MATPPDSPIEEVVYELEPTRVSNSISSGSYFEED